MNKSRVAPKKYLGQHFLKDEIISEKIAALLNISDCKNVLEIGPGMGMLTKYLIKKSDCNLKVIEIDQESIVFLKKNFPELNDQIISGDFLKLNISELFNREYFSIIGNFPYNISSQILFKVLENKDRVPQVVGMFQKEVAERIASLPGNKSYGILSVLLQAYYTINYHFTVDENVFDPPPKVKSGVISLTRNSVQDLGCSDDKFKRVVKQGFSQRRKTLRNALKPLLKINLEPIQHLLSKRAEELSVKEFVDLTKFLMD